MWLRALLGSLHLLGLGLGLSGVLTRARALGEAAEDPTPAAMQRVFFADNLWGIAALLWIGTGLARAFAGFEKGTAYYLASHAFLTKIALLLVVIALEIAPMIALIRARMGQPVDAAALGRYARISWIQAVITVVMVALAGVMARGLG
jgi:putative membrane protein